MLTIEQDHWKTEVSRHENRVSPWIYERRDRASHHINNPIYDFLFTYYSFRPSHLLRWSPGINVLIKNGALNEFPGSQDFQRIGDDLILLPSQFPEHRRPYLTWAIRYLEQTANRQPHYSCFGLHEWAMVYHTTDKRHLNTPLRISPQEIDQLCDSTGLRCTHYDAFRFFTPEAAPKNIHTLTRATTTNNDQPACIHVTMDLYRFAYKIAPFIPATLMADAFELAAFAREIDMRASPYDLREYGFESIKIETTEGRKEYIEYQKVLFERAQRIRQSILSCYQLLMANQCDTASHYSGLGMQ